VVYVSFACVLVHALEPRILLAYTVQFCSRFVQFTAFVSTLKDPRCVQLCKRMFPLKDVKAALQRCDDSSHPEIQV
jgi:hypothetical protein